MLKMIRQQLIKLTAFMMAFSFVPAYGPLASELPKENPAEDLASTSTPKSAPTEVKAERTENEKVYDNHDGTFTKRIFAEPIHMKEKGEMKPLDANLEKEKTVIQPKQTPFDAEFLEKMNDGDYARFKAEGLEVTFSLKEARNGAKITAAVDQKATYKKMK